MYGKINCWFDSKDNGDLGFYCSATPPTQEETDDHYHKTVFNMKKKDKKIKPGKIIPFPYQAIQDVNNAVTNPASYTTITGCTTTITPTRITFNPNGSNYTHYVTASGTDTWIDGEAVTGTAANTGVWAELKTGQWYTWTTTLTPSDGYANHIWAYPSEARPLSKEEQAKLDKAEKKSMELLREWLSESEWNYLMEQGELEIPSKIHDDEIYIVKKAAYEKVIKKKKGKAVSRHCIITKGHYPEGDVLLNKIMLLKTDEEQFLKVAIKTPIHDQIANVEPPRYNGNLEPYEVVPIGPRSHATYRER